MLESRLLRNVGLINTVVHLNESRYVELNYFSHQFFIDSVDIKQSYMLLKILSKTKSSVFQKKYYPII